jgi:hypothetical protein
MKLERVMGIEPNEHRISRFQGKYSYHTHLTENPERPNSPYVSVMLVCGILRFCDSQCFLGNWREEWDCGEDHLNIL